MCVHNVEINFKVITCSVQQVNNSSDTHTGTLKIIVCHWWTWSHSQLWFWGSTSKKDG